MTGTLVNIAAILVGGTIGIIFKRRLPAKTIEVVLQGIALVTIAIGVSMFLKSEQLIVVILSIMAGGVTGGLAQIENRLNSVSIYLQKHLKQSGDNFIGGITTSFLLFCMGAMTIVGAIDEGLGNGSELLLTKSILDGFTSIALASTLGIGVLFSVVPLLIFQGGITLLAIHMGSIFNPQIINELSATGGVLLIGLGLNMLNVTKIKILDILPALFFSGIFAYIYYSII